MPSTAEIEAADRKARKAPPVKNTPEDQAVSDRAYQVTAGELRQFIERIQTTAKAKTKAATDQKEIYSEAKGRGYNAKVLRKVIAHLEKTPKDLAAAEEEAAIMDLYLTALEGQEDE